MPKIQMEARVYHARTLRTFFEGEVYDITDEEFDEFTKLGIIGGTRAKAVVLEAKKGKKAE